MSFVLVYEDNGSSRQLYRHCLVSSWSPHCNYQTSTPARFRPLFKKVVLTETVP